MVFGKAADVKVADVTVEKIIAVGDSTGKIPMVVSGVTMSEDKKTASVSLFSNLENGATYVVTVAGYEESAEFVASYGVPVSMTIAAEKTVYVNSDPIKLTYKLFDAAGNDVTNTANGSIVFTAGEAATTDYFVDNGYIIINKDGAVATVNAKYSFYKNETDLDQTVIEATGYIVGVTKAADSLASVSIAPIFWGSTLKQVPVNLYDPSNGVSATLEVKIKTTNSDDDGSYKYSNGESLQYAIGGTTPQIRLRSSNPEVFDIDGNTVVPFKEGTSAVLLELVTINNDGSENVNTVAAQYITVSAAAKVSKVVVNGSITTGTVANFATAKVGLGVQDQYGFTWGLNAVTGYERRLNEETEDPNDYIQENGADKWFPVYRTDVNNNTTFQSIKFENGKDITSGSVYFEERGNSNGWADQVVVDGNALFADMVASKYITEDWKVNDKAVTSITKRIVIKNDAKNGMGDGLEFTVVVTLKKATGNVITSVVAEGTTSGNIAVYNTPNDTNDNAEQIKNATFKVFTTQNGVKTAQLPLAGVKPADGVVPTGVSSGALYYTLTRNGNDITALINDGDYAAIKDDGSSVKVEYNDNYGEGYEGGYNTVAYTKYSNVKGFNIDLGAGNYVFTVYKVADNTTTGKQYFAYVGSAKTSVTCDAGSYSYTKRLSETVTAAFTEDDLRACFEVAGTDGKKTEVATYSVDYRDAADYVHVNSITFYEPLDGGSNYVAYKVTINAALKKVQ